MKKRQEGSSGTPQQVPQQIIGSHQIVIYCYSCHVYDVLSRQG